MFSSVKKRCKIELISNTYELTEAPVRSLSVATGAATIDAVVVVVVVEASIADVNSSICLDVSTTTSVI